MVLRQTILIYTILISFCLASPNRHPPTFSDFRINVIHKEEFVRPKILTSEDHEYKYFLHNIDIPEVNYAGHYFITTIGCGTSCVMVAIIDVLNGHVLWLPFTISASDQSDPDWQPIAYKKDSTLLVVNGARNERGNGTHYYVIKHGEISLLR